MNKRRLLMSLPLFAMTLTSCSETINWEKHLDSYVDVMQFHENFNVLQLTDIHWSVNSSTASSKQYLNKVLKEVDRKIKAEQGVDAKIDLIELTGDQFMLANTYHAKTFIEYFESKAAELKFKYTVIWGNHDRHGLYSPNWLSDQYKEAKNCIYIEPEDNLYGRSNFVINLTDDGTKDGTTKWQLYNLDSGASFSESPLSIGRDYDYIREDQVKWFKEERQLQPSANAIAYYHIPQQDNQVAWDAIHNDGATYKNKFFKLEGFCDNGNEVYASDFIKVGRENNLKAAFMGHAHNVDWTVEVDGVVIGLGVKTGGELYYAHIDPEDKTPELQEGLASINAGLSPEDQIKEKFDLIGASLVTIKDENSFDLEHLYLNEREGTDFVRWVKW